MRVVVVGAGIIGASIARQLQQAGCAVTVIDRGMPGQGASARSFGWINASFFADPAHYRLRLEAMAAWKRSALPTVRWPGCLWWEESGASFDAMQQALAALDYPVRALEAAEVRALEPDLSDVPERALLFPTEGIADLQAGVALLLSGIPVMAGVEITGLAEHGGRVVGVDTATGRVPADLVVLAAGIGAPDLLAGVGVPLPMLDRPGLLLRTAPMEPLIRHILVTPGLEVQQDPQGRIVAPTSPSHQGDTRSRIEDAPDRLADRAMDRIGALLGRDDLRWDDVFLAMRPVPGDGLPVVGPAGPEGLYVAVMHSGATLAALVGELAAAEITGQGAAPLLAPYRPGRFARGA